ESCPRGESKDADGDGHRQFEKIGSPNERSGCRHAVGDLPKIGPSVGDGENPVALDTQGDCDEQDNERLFKDRPCLKSKKDDDRSEQSNDRQRLELAIELVQGLTVLTVEQRLAGEGSG